MQRELQEEEERQKKKIEDFRKQCAKQLEENKMLKDMQKQKEMAEDNKPPSGKDLMH